MHTSYYLNLVKTSWTYCRTKTCTYYLVKHYLIFITTMLIQGLTESNCVTSTSFDLRSTLTWLFSNCLLGTGLHWIKSKPCLPGVVSIDGCGPGQADRHTEAEEQAYFHPHSKQAKCYKPTYRQTHINRADFHAYTYQSKIIFFILQGNDNGTSQTLHIITSS